MHRPKRVRRQLGQDHTLTLIVLVDEKFSRHTKESKDLPEDLPSRHGLKIKHLPDLL